jgi:hypothetical protein
MNWRLPRRIPDHAALLPEANERRLRAHDDLARITDGCGSICASCGRCCLEDVDRFTPFDSIVRRSTTSPPPSEDRRIYYLPWMIWNSVYHAAQKLLPRSHRKPPPPCRHLTPAGCGLPHQERPMICVSWFCPTFMLSMKPEDIKAMQVPLREIESLHQEALQFARACIKGKGCEKRRVEPVDRKPDT